jgi:arylsulfate sulfotransferase
MIEQVRRPPPIRTDLASRREESRLMHRRLPFAAIFLAALGISSAPLSAIVTIKSLTPSLASPQPVGTPVAWSVGATDSNPNSLTFQFNVAYASQPYALVRDFNIGIESAGKWRAQPFAWASIAGEGVYTIQVVAKDFVSGETATRTASFTLTSLAPGSQATVHKTANTLVALFSAPSCATGSSMRVAFYTGTNPAGYTNWAPCNSPVSMNFYVAGMLPSTTYTMYSQTQTGTNTVNGANLSFTTGAVPTNLGKAHLVPTFTVNVAAGSKSDTADATLLWGFTTNVMPVATDLNGDIIWYYPGGEGTLVTRPLPGATILTIQTGTSWNSKDKELQLIREIDLAGNVVHETNAGVVAHQLIAMGATDAGSCVGVPNPAPVGTACLNDFDHEAMRYSIGSNSYTAVLAHIEKVFPAGTQGSDPNGPPVDILTEMVVVLDAQWQVVWYYDSFQQLDLNRAAVLGEACTSKNCSVTLLLAPVANDWTHANTIQYQAASGNLLVSLRNQDWLILVNYDNGVGAGNILWRMGLDGDFTMVAPKSDTWPWFSHQHDAGYANSGAGPLTVFDNGNTRVSKPPLGQGKGDSRGMALTVDETTMQVTPVLSVSLGVYANALGSAQLLSDGLYLFEPGTPKAYAIEILPTPDSLNGTQVLNILSPNVSYRAWQMPNLYAPPAW